MVQEEILRLAIIVAGQGPEAFGMPEMFTPMQHINANRQLKRLATLISDGRYSGVSYGAAIGHMTPEAYKDGDLLYLQEGDLLYLGFRKKQIDLLDQEAFIKGEIVPYQGQLQKERERLGQQRKAAMKKRQKTIAPSNRLVGCTDAAEGVVPIEVKVDADVPYQAVVMKR
ncbi:dihydroxy-acid dehydratase [Halobacillus karajensis]|nr:Dihydroxy-acid dehydratase [Halobacillus karajensis]